MECFATLFGMKSCSRTSHCLVEHEHTQNLRLSLRMRWISARTYILYERRLANRHHKIPSGHDIGREGQRATIKVLCAIGFMANKKRFILAPCLTDQVMSFG